MKKHFAVLGLVLVFCSPIFSQDTIQGYFVSSDSFSEIPLRDDARLAEPALCVIPNDSMIMMWSKCITTQDGVVWHYVEYNGVLGYVPAEDIVYQQSVRFDPAPDSLFCALLFSDSSMPKLVGEKNLKLYEKWMSFYQIPKQSRILQRGLLRMRLNKDEKFHIIYAESQNYPKLRFPQMTFKGLGESNGVTTAKSWVGATGFWQFMYQTALYRGLVVSRKRGIDERCDMKKSTRAAFFHSQCLYNLMEEWKEDLPGGGADVTDDDLHFFADAAYNCGEGNIEGVFFACKGKFERFPEEVPFDETEDYIPKYLAIQATTEGWVRSGTMLVTPVKVLKTSADITHDGYLEKRRMENITPSEEVDCLDVITQMYKGEEERKEHDPVYVKNARSIIAKERQRALAAESMANKPY